jgi:hypothetical protein
MENNTVISIESFGRETFLQLNITFVDRYASLRVRAVNSLAAFRRVFGNVNCDNQMYARIQCLEASDTYNDLFDAKLKVIPLDEILSARKALHSYVDIAANPMAKDSAKIAALKEAAVLANITIIDEKGNSRRGRSLDDFYAAVDAMDKAPGAAAPEPAQPASERTQPLH